MQRREATPGAPRLPAADAALQLFRGVEADRGLLFEVHGGERSPVTPSDSSDGGLYRLAADDALRELTGTIQE